MHKHTRTHPNKSSYHKQEKNVCLCRDKSGSRRARATPWDFSAIRDTLLPGLVSARGGDSPSATCQFISSFRARAQHNAPVAPKTKKMSQWCAPTMYKKLKCTGNRARCTRARACMRLTTVASFSNCLFFFVCAYFNYLFISKVRSRVISEWHFLSLYTVYLFRWGFAALKKKSLLTI